MYRFNIFLIFILFFLPATMQAQRILTLEEAIATALENNYFIRLARQDSLSADINYKYRDAVFLPTLNAGAQTLWNVSNQTQQLVDSTRNSGVRNHTSQANIALNWTLFDGFRMFATRDKAAVLLQAGTLAIKEQMVTTIAEVIRNYYNIARQKQQINAADMQINLNRERAKLAQYKLDIGVGAKPDVLQSQADLNSQTAIKMQQEANIDILKRQLAQAMNDRTGADFDIPDTIPVNYNVALGDILADLDNTNPSLLLAQKNIEAAKLTLKETRAGLYPTVSFVSNYNFNRNRNNIAITRFSPLFSQNNGFNYGFSANIPIFNQFRVRKQIRQDELNISFQQLNYENRKSLLQLDIFNAYRNYDHQKKALQLEEQNIAIVKELLFIVSEKYRLGMGTLIELREAQNSLAQAYDRLIQARYNAKLSETELMRLRGDIVK